MIVWGMDADEKRDDQENSDSEEEEPVVRIRKPTMEIMEF